MTVEQWLGKDNLLGIDIWMRKYRKNEESFDEWLDRVSGNNEAIKALIIEKKFIPGGRILSNRGITDTRVTYSNCYVITPPEDNIESIFESRKKLARTYSYGGGCGIDLSKLAPAGAKVHNQAEQTTGAVSFMQGYSQTTEEIGQAGRRGALMISLDCHHPDLLDFIDVKTSPDAVTKANISVRVTDDFMEAVINDKDWIMSFTRPETNETITRTARAREIFEKLCKNNWDWGEPGILFWDTISNYNLLEFDDTFEYAGVNPCAEEPLPAGGSCLLSSINLSAFVKDKEFDFDDFSETVANGVIYLNEVLEEGLSLHPLEEQRQSVADWRQIGLGIMGLADMLIKMELPYDSEQARQLCEEIGLVMADQALYTSAFLAGHAGSYNNYKSCVQKSEFLKNNTCESTREVIEAYGLRNSQLLTIAPTGTISTMLGISGGIEPIFANSYTRKTESLHGHDEYYKVYTPIVKEYMDEHGIKDETELPNWFCTSSTISPLNRVLMQGVWQKHIDASISSTVNLPEEATIEDVEEIYLNAWKEGLKGITVFRNGCKRLGILTTNNSQEKEEEKGLSRGEIISCSDNLIGMKRRLTTGCGSLHCTAWFDPHTGDLMEIYLNKGSTGGCVDADTEYFNGTEWKKISTYKRGSQEKVLQYNLNGTAELVIPDNYIVNENISNLVHFRNHYGLDMVLSNDHRIFAYKNYQKYKMGIRKSLTYEIMTVDEYIQRDSSKERHIPTTFRMNAPGLPLNEQIIRLLVCVYADGTWNGDRIVVNVKKDRKKERIEKLLKEANIGYSRRDIYNTQYSIFSFYAPTQQKEWFVDKQFTPKWLNCSDEQAKIVIDECVYWDGSIEEGNRLGAYYSSKKQEIDILQFLLARIGYRGTISDNTSTVSKVPSYRLRWTERNVHNLEFAEISNYQTIDGKSYCFSVPSTLLVLRRNNKIFITGNCANFMVGLSRMISLACRGGVKIEDIADQLQSTGACPSYASRTATKHDTSKGACCPMAVGNALMEMWKEMKERIEKGNSIISLANSNSQIPSSESKTSFNPEIDNGAKCPECGSELIQEGGCVICKSCGWSRCG